MLHLRGEHTDLSLLRPGDYRFCWNKGNESKTATAQWGREMNERSVAALVQMIRQRTRPPHAGPQ